MKFCGSRRIKTFIRNYPEGRYAVNMWLKILRETVWKRDNDITKTFKHAVNVDGYWLFELDGCRIASKVWLEQRWTRILQMMPLAQEYDISRWKVTDEKYLSFTKRRHSYTASWFGDDKRLDEADEFLDAHYQRLGDLSWDQEYHLFNQSMAIADFESHGHRLLNDPTSIADRLKFLMKNNDLTADDLSDIFGLSPDEWADIADGESKLPSQKVALLALYFVVDRTLFGSVNSYGVDVPYYRRQR